MKKFEIQDKDDLDSYVVVMAESVEAAIELAWKEWRMRVRKVWEL